MVREPASGYVTGSGSSSGCDLELAEELERVRTALVRLPPEQQLVVQLRLIENKTFNEIAQLLGLPLGTVLSRMRLAMEKLRSKLA